MHNSTSKEPIRIQKVIAMAGIASRRAAEKLILSGEVILNGETVKEMGQKMIIGKDHLSVEGRRIKFLRSKKRRSMPSTSLKIASRHSTILRDVQQSVTFFHEHLLDFFQLAGLTMTRKV